MTQCFHVPMPPVGSHWSRTEKTTMRRMATTNVGVTILVTTATDNR